MLKGVIAMINRFVMSILIAIACCSVKDFDENSIAKVCGRVIIRNVIITKSFYNKDNEDNEDAIIIISCDDVISISYSYIKFIALFKYLTLYHVSNFDS